MDPKVVVPCINCITKAVCRHKSYYELVQCPLLKEMYSSDLSYDPPSNIAAHKPQKELLTKALKPTKWFADDHGWVHEETFIGHPGNDGMEELK